MRMVMCMAIVIENTEVWGWKHAIRGMRNSMNSWDRCDSECHEDGTFSIGINDETLMRSLVKAGSSHRKFLRQIFVSLDVIAPLYWWKEADTYKVGTVANSCSTMHKIADREFVLDDFSTDHLDTIGKSEMMILINVLNHYRERYNNHKLKDDWWQLIQLLPASYNQKRTLTLNYENLLNIYFQRKDHKLDEWHVFCEWIEGLPMMSTFIEALEDDAKE